MCVSPLPRLLVSASQDGKLIVWDTYTTNKVSARPAAPLSPAFLGHPTPFLCPDLGAQPRPLPSHPCRSTPSHCAPPGS